MVCSKAICKIFLPEPALPKARNQKNRDPQPQVRSPKNPSLQMPKVHVE